MNRRRAILGTLGTAVLTGCGRAASQPATPPPFPMRRGVNLGNALEAPNEGDWGYRIEPDHLAAIAAAGFDGARLPVRWDAHTEREAPYTIDPEFMARVEQVISGALAQHLIVQADVHHYDDLIDNPERELPRFRAIWRQIAAHFHGAPPTLIFEPLNEPNGPNWPVSRVSAYEDAAATLIRAHDPTRFTVWGGPNWNSIDGLTAWSPPLRVAHCGVTVHYYEPHDFTHQNAEWLGDNAPQFNRDWGTVQDIHAIAADADRAVRWATAHEMPLQLGEFGANARVPLAQRALWTRTVRQAFENVGAGWCVWDFAGAFPIWDRDQKRFIPEMLSALMD